MKQYNFFQIVVTVCLMIFVSDSFAQKDEAPLLKINGNSYSVDEFDYIYKKNNSLSQYPVSRKEYLDLFVNYKLKVNEAIAQGMDTTSSFKKELAYYRNEVAKPYLTDKKALNDLVKEAYARMQEEVDVSHILIRLPQNAYPEDTLKAFEKITGIRKNIIDGVDFETMALEYSEDPSVKKNKGHLGYITVFMTVYPFESAAYNTPVGDISPVVRTSYGYHIVKVNAKRESRGEIKVAHIMKVVPKNASPDVQQKAKNEIDSIYQLLQDGADFKTLAEKLSDDRNSAAKGGELEWFSTGKMIPEFADAAFMIPENGEYSTPVRSRVGWHIIYRIDKRGIKPYDELKDELEKKISKSKRSLSGKTETVKRLKKENDFRVDSATVEYLKKTFLTKGISTEKFYEKLEGFNEPLCYFADTTLFLGDFANYLKKGRKVKAGTSPLLLENALNDFFNDELIDFEKAHLEEKYPEFRYLVNEYHDGLLIFEISQKEIWNKATADTAGLRKFFEDNSEKYAIPEKFTGDIFFCRNKKTLKEIEKLTENTNTVIDTASLKKMHGIDFLLRSGEFVKGEDPLYDAVLWKVKPDEKIQYPEGYSKSCFFGKFTDGKPVEFDSVKGLVLADYQTFIEKEWIYRLKEKFKPEINYVVFRKSKR